MVCPLISCIVIALKERNIVQFLFPHIRSINKSAINVVKSCLQYSYPTAYHIDMDKCYPCMFCMMEVCVITEKATFVKLSHSAKRFVSSRDK